MSEPQRHYSDVNGQRVLTTEAWYCHTNTTASGWHLHRVDGPALQYWEIINGQPILTNEIWYLNGKMHRSDGIANRVWTIVNDQAFIIGETWYLHGRLHRLTGPAYRYWEIVDGVPVLHTEEWYIDGNEIDPDDLRVNVRKIERWWLVQRVRRHQGIEQSLLQGGMIVFPGLMGLLKEY